MTKETVLEIEFQPVFDKWGWKITKQNKEILKRGKFEDKGIGVYSVNYPKYSYSECVLNIRGNIEEEDNRINICTGVEKREIEVKVRNINKKYGIKKRWRADIDKRYYYINEEYNILSTFERYHRIDIFRYNNGNYFETEEEVKKYAEYMKKKSLEWHKNKFNNEE